MLLEPIKTKNEIITWIRNYFQENGPECTAVVGISGGKDSSVVAALCAETLGKDRVLGVLMPSGVQPDIDYSKKLVDHLGIPHVEVNIGDAEKALIATIEKNQKIQAISGSESLSKDTKINLPARLRMTTLYAVAQSVPKGGRVANTCNRSEDYVGYSTKFGDAAGDFSPMAHMLVEEVRQIGRTLGLPEDLIEKIPTDGLSGKTDEDKLGFTYETLDHYIQTGECADTEIKEKINRLHRINLHKLQPMPMYKPDWIK